MSSSAPDDDPAPSLPGVLQIGAAHVAARVIDQQGTTVSGLHTAFLHVPTGGLHDQGSLIDGLELLIALGLVAVDAGRATPTPDLLAMRRQPAEAFAETLVERVFTVRNDMWLPSFAGSDQVRWELVPDDAKILLTKVFDEPSRRDQFVLSAARKVDAALLAEIGAAGEEHIVSCCQAYLRSKGRADLAEDVARLSLLDDTLGYDITSPDCAGRVHHLEAKASRALGGLVEFYVTRNEVKIGEADPMWSVVIAQQQIVGGDGSLALQLVGWLVFEDIVDVLPSDAPLRGDLAGRWTVARISLPDDRLRPGLPLDQRAPA